MKNWLLSLRVCCWLSEHSPWQLLATTRRSDWPTINQETANLGFVVSCIKPLIIPPCFLVLPKQSPHRTHCFALCSCPIFHQNVPLIPKFPFFQALSTIHEYFYYIFAVKKYVCCNAPLESRIFFYVKKWKRIVRTYWSKKSWMAGSLTPLMKKSIKY